MKAAFERWRRELAAQAGLTAEIRRELEAHLQDCIAGFQQLGFGESEAFRLACQRIGRPQKLNAEFEKSMNATSHWNRPLAIAAWMLFIVSFFLPAFGSMPGYGCAILQDSFWPGTLQGNLFSIHYELLLLANLLMLASPLLLTQFSRNARQLQRLHHITLAAAILVCTFVLRVLISQDHGQGDGLKIGCFVWSVSFILLYLSVLSQLVRLRKESEHKPA